MVLIRIRAVLGDAFGFPTEGCVDEAGVNACLALADRNMAQNCATVCGGECTDAFTCTSTTDACLTGCMCVTTQEYINCVLSSCWNKVRCQLIHGRPSLI